MVDSCCATLCLHVPVTAFGPHTATMKSRMMSSNSELFQFVAGFVGVQSGGVSSVTTTCGYGYPAQMLTTRQQRRGVGWGRG